MKPIKFTGERIILNLSTPKNIIEHHLARYEFAKKYVKNKVILDIACGTGYGSFILSNSGAKKVIGGDISKEAVAYSKENYKRKNLLFKKMSCENIKVKDNSIDVVVSFETIEHIKNYRKFLAEISRVLKKGGIFICSSPNKKITSPYTKKPSNKYHIKEFYIDELKKEIINFFFLKKVYGQLFLKDNLKFKIKKFIGTFIPNFLLDFRKKNIQKKQGFIKKDKYLLKEIDKMNELSPTYFTIIAQK